MSAHCWCPLTYALPVCSVSSQAGCVGRCTPEYTKYVMKLFCPLNSLAVIAKATENVYTDDACSSGETDWVSHTACAVNGHVSTKTHSLPNKTRHMLRCWCWRLSSDDATCWQSLLHPQGTVTILDKSESCDQVWTPPAGMYVAVTQQLLLPYGGIL